MKRATALFAFAMLVRLKLDDCNRDLGSEHEAKRRIHFAEGFRAVVFFCFDVFSRSCGG